MSFLARGSTGLQRLQRHCSNLTYLIQLCYNSHAISQSGNNDYQPLQSVSSSLPVIALGGQIGCVTVILVLVAAFGGIWLDNILGTKPLITIVLILGAAPLSLYLTYVMAVKAINNSLIPPTINLDNPDERCDPKMDYVPLKAREAKVNVAISNSFGFGGHNACLVVAKI